jgi:quercetin dioxygenase-like cupin family protein
MVHKKDYRGKNWWDIFPFLRGQVNFTHNYKGTIRAFHRHQKQMDYWFCVYGEARVNLDGKEIYMSQGDYLEIPPKTWHGMEALTDCGIIYYTTAKSNDLPKEERDEERAPFDLFDWNKEWK